MNKKELRKIIKDRKRQYSSSQLEELSLSVLSRLADQESFRKAKIILMYYSLPDEVNTHTFIDEMTALGKTVLLPVVKDSEICHNILFLVPDGCLFHQNSYLE